MGNERDESSEQDPQIADVLRLVRYYKKNGKDCIKKTPERVKKREYRWRKGIFR